MRARPIPMEEAAVRPGMSGGQYKPLTGHDMQRIHEKALKLLETVGLAQAIPTCVEAMTARGCFVNARGRLCIPRALVEDTLASCARNFVLHARDPNHDMQPSGNRAYFGTAGAPVHIVEPETRMYRDSLLVDLYDAGRIVDTCEHIHFYHEDIDLVKGTVVPCILTDPASGDRFDAPVTIEEVDGSNYTIGVQVADAPKP